MLRLSETLLDGEERFIKTVFLRARKIHHKHFHGNFMKVLEQVR